MCFYLVTFTLAIPLFVAMLAMFPFTYLADKVTPEPYLHLRRP
jgi:hypothetical protein